MLLCGYAQWAGLFFPRCCGAVTHIDGDMAYDARVMREPDILILIVHTFGIDGAFGSWFIVNDESARDVDLDGTGVGDSLLQAWTGLSPHILRVRIGGHGGGGGGGGGE